MHLVVRIVLRQSNTICNYYNIHKYPSCLNTMVESAEAHISKKKQVQSHELPNTSWLYNSNNTSIIAIITIHDYLYLFI